MPTLLESHFAAQEALLHCSSTIAANSGHSLHKGTPREWFVREFLSDHLSERVAIGTGEVIDCSSQPGEQRNQMDIVIYWKSYPKIHFGGGIHGFLAESVLATIEVKSTLTEVDMKAAISAAKKIKGLRRCSNEMKQGWHPPAILNFVVGYDGPAKMETILGWVQKTYTELAITNDPLPADASARYSTPSPALDGIFQLGRGFLLYDNWPVWEQLDPQRQNRWVLSSAETGSLFLLFLLLTRAQIGTISSQTDCTHYTQGSKFNLTQA